IKKHLSKVGSSAFLCATKPLAFITHKKPIPFCFETCTPLHPLKQPIAQNNPETTQERLAHKSVAGEFFKTKRLRFLFRHNRSLSFPAEKIREKSSKNFLSQKLHKNI